MIIVGGKVVIVAVIVVTVAISKKSGWMCGLFIFFMVLTNLTILNMLVGQQSFLSASRRHTDELRVIYWSILEAV